MVPITPLVAMMAAAAPFFFWQHFTGKRDTGSEFAGQAEPGYKPEYRV